jgi:hypothetical protein
MGQRRRFAGGLHSRFNPTRQPLIRCLVAPVTFAVLWISCIMLLSGNHDSESCEHGDHLLRFASAAPESGPSSSTTMQSRLFELWDKASRDGLLVFQQASVSARTVWYQPSTPASSAAATAAAAAACARFDLVFNPTRAKKRLPPGENVAVAESVNRGWDSDAFNFHRADARELLFGFHLDLGLNLAGGRGVGAAGSFSCETWAGPLLEHAAFINRFPLSAYSGVLVPYYQRNL